MYFGLLLTISAYNVTTVSQIDLTKSWHISTALLDDVQFSFRVDTRPCKAYYISRLIVHNVMMIQSMQTPGNYIKCLIPESKQMTNHCYIYE